MISFIKGFVFLGMTIFISNTSFAEQKMIKVGWGYNLRVVIEQNPEVEPKADVLFLIGFSDRADNHGPLFSQLVASGFRVISFDYPSHGETDCWGLNLQDIASLQILTQIVLVETQEKAERPLYMTGWSTGGLLAYRMMQQGQMSFRDVKGLVLLAPGLAVYKVPGVWGFVTLDTLLSNPNPPHKGDIYPSSPLQFPLFGADLIGHSVLARLSEVPDVPILMILGDDEADVYAKTPKIKKWYKSFKSESPQFVSYQCASAKHELDNEIEPIGQTVRDLFVNFINNTEAPASDACVKL